MNAYDLTGAGVGPCKTCIYWTKANIPATVAMDGNGLCRRYPPTWSLDYAKVGNVERGEAEAKQPFTHETEECGEHREPIV